VLAFRLRVSGAEAPVKIIFCILLSVASVARAQCLSLDHMNPTEVDILSGETVAMLLSSHYATVCMCDEKDLKAVLFQIMARHPFTTVKAYFAPDRGYCEDLKSGWD
jgi:hypothetical protein